MTMTFEKGLALSTNINLLNYRTCLLPMKTREIPRAYTKKLVWWYHWMKSTHTQKKKKMRGSHTFRFKIPQFKDMTFTCINMDDRLQLSIILTEVKKRSEENKVVKRLKIPRISSTRSGIDILFGKIPPCMHAQIQQIEIYSPLDPPIY